MSGLLHLHGRPKESGGIVIDGRHVADTLRCVHCGYNWEIKVGSGIRRGWCPDCKGAVCGAQGCMASCSPVEARIILAEAIAKKDFKTEMDIRLKYVGIQPI